MADQAQLLIGVTQEKGPALPQVFPLDAGMMKRSWKVSFEQSRAILTEGRFQLEGLTLSGQDLGN
jgi:hypothetical protein